MSFDPITYALCKKASGGGLPVIVVSGIPDENLNIQCTAAESAMFDAALEARMPVILRLIMLGDFACVMHLGGGTYFAMMNSTDRLDASKNNDGWHVSIIVE